VEIRATLVRVISRLARPALRWRLTAKGVRLGTGVRFVGFPTISAVRDASIRIGSRSTFVSSSSVAMLGASTACIVRARRAGASVIIGDDCGFTGIVIGCCTAITIGDRVLTGSNVTIVDNDFHPIHSIPRHDKPAPSSSPGDAVVIEDDVFLGMGATVLKGVRVGRGSVIAARSVVTRSIPPFSIAAGNPARVIGQVRQE